MRPSELLARRRAMGLSQAALAERLGVAANTVARSFSILRRIVGFEEGAGSTAHAVTSDFQYPSPDRRV